MMLASRRRSLAVVALLALPVLVATGCGSDTKTRRAELRIEESPIPPPTGEVIVYVEDAANTRARAGGRTQVTLECLDRSGDVVLRGKHRWPFRNSDGGNFKPHVHQRLSERNQGSVVRCRLAGTEGPLYGWVSAAGLP